MYASVSSGEGGEEPCGPARPTSSNWVTARVARASSRKAHCPRSRGGAAGDRRVATAKMRCGWVGAREPEMVVVGDKEGFPSLAGGIRGMSILHP